jgi:mannose-6-phosphate isomerase-like protein (cupin superfamily)
VQSQQDKSQQDMPSSGTNLAEVKPFGVARLEMKKGSLTHTHHHETECLLIVLEGACRIYLKNGTVTVRQNEMLRIPPQHTHVAEALADTVALSISSSCSSAGDWTGCGPVFHHDSDQYLWGV